MTKKEKKIVKGFKVLNQDMSSAVGEGPLEDLIEDPVDKMNDRTGEEIKFELGKTYITEGKPIPNENGFHFCTKIEDLNCCYDMLAGRIFEVEAIDVRHAGGRNHYVAKTITIMRELAKDEIINYLKENHERIIRSGSTYAKIALVKHAIALDILIKNRDYEVREAVAEQGYGLDRLVNDERFIVRETAINMLKSRQ